MLEFCVDVQTGTNDATDSKADDEQHRILAVRHIVDDCVDADACGREAHGVEQDTLLLFFESFFE